MLWACGVVLVQAYIVEPNLRVTGANPFRVGVSLALYHDEGADCSDEVPFDENLNSNVVTSGDEVSLKVPGTYYVKYTCSNDRDMVTTSTRTVIVDKQFNSGCHKMQVKGPSMLGAIGTYMLMPDSHDGAPVYKQIDGPRTNHMFFVDSADQNVHEWVIVSYSLRKIQRMRWGELSPFTTGLRVNDRHVLPEKITGNWEAWNEGSWYKVDSVKLQCLKCSLEDEKYCLTSEAEPSGAKPRYSISFAVEIDGYNKADFGKIVEYDFVVSVADSLGVPVSDVKVTSILDSESFDSNIDTDETLESEDSTLARLKVRVSVLTNDRFLVKLVEEDVAQSGRLLEFKTALMAEFQNAGMLTKHVAITDISVPNNIKEMVAAHPTSQGSQTSTGGAGSSGGGGLGPLLLLLLLGGGGYVGFHHKEQIAAHPQVRQILAKMNVPHDLFTPSTPGAEFNAMPDNMELAGLTGPAKGYQVFNAASRSLSKYGSGAGVSDEYGSTIGHQGGAENPELEL